jgi:hypothetical protein
MNPPPRHLSAVKDVLDGAVEPPIDDFPGHEPLYGEDPVFGRGDELPPDGGFAMPPGCPVEPLGTENNIFYFLTALGELRALAADKVANKHIVGMFAPYTAYLFDTWPRKKWSRTRTATRNGSSPAGAPTTSRWS